ncbi:hypothetical protein H4R18_000043 [Coemansia javaensis]|uniref:Uncharacterized protein n=1 Tax=Coemansia javaensis TaxID=2761396 RepID=A0A9W8HHD2_9FUNG|nr:hypothetical protein H4R18_000043 [Coemansia javaensis]
MHGGAVVAALALVLAGASCAAPLSHIGPRQADTAPPDGYGDPVFAGDDVLPDPAAADAFGGWAPDAQADPQMGAVDNLVGNSFAQIDDSVNVNDVDIEYPGDAELTGNAGTAVSGNSNQIMPIINAPVTVIVSQDDALQPAGKGVPQQHQHHHHHHQQQARPPVAPALAQAQWVAANDPFGDRIQQLIAYALAVSQSRMA